MYNIEVVKELIRKEGYDKFALCHYSVNFDDEFNHYYISPISFGDRYITRHGAIFDNLDNDSYCCMSKEELILKFQLIFGYDVEYFWDDKTGLTILK
jgi:hypothetical protein